MKAKKGDSGSRKAIKVMVAKAKKGDPQAIRDVNAVKAGRIVVRARAKAQRKQLVAQKRAARKEKVASLQKKFENRAGDRPARMSRKNELKKLAKVERKAAKGDSEGHSLRGQACRRLQAGGQESPGPGRRHEARPDREDPGDEPAGSQADEGRHQAGHPCPERRSESPPAGRRPQGRL